MEIINDELRLKDITRAQSIFADLDGKLKRAGGKAPKELKFEHETLQKVTGTSMLWWSSQFFSFHNRLSSSSTPRNCKEAHSCWWLVRCWDRNLEQTPLPHCQASRLPHQHEPQRLHQQEEQGESSFYRKACEPESFFFLDILTIAFLLLTYSGSERSRLTSMASMEEWCSHFVLTMKLSS